MRTDEARTHDVYRTVQHALQSAAAVLAGRACLTSYGMAYLGLKPKAMR